MDLDEQELKATREMVSKNKFSEYTEKWIVEFVKNQEEFVKEQCYNYLANNKIVRTFKIDRDTLEYIFNLGFTEYKKKNEKSADELFDELGYNNKEDDEYSIIKKDNNGKEIKFYKEDKEIECYYWDYGDFETATINMDELKAIYKECQEKGWIE